MKKNLQASRNLMSYFFLVILAMGVWMFYSGNVVRDRFSERFNRSMDFKTRQEMFKPTNHKKANNVDKISILNSATSRPIINQYRVIKGDTLNRISEKTGIDIEEILYKNPTLKKNPDFIIPGQILDL